MPIEQQVAQLVQQFSAAPWQFFHEKELHATFFGLCRSVFPLVNTHDRHAVHLFRHEYDTVWKYARRDPEPYTERLTDRGTTACFDFAVLDQHFVLTHDLLTVTNKDEALRRVLRNNAWTNTGTSAVLDTGIEFKMAHRRDQFDILQGQVNALRAGMLLDARKLAIERVGNGYLLGFSHGPPPDEPGATGILLAALAEHAQRNGGVGAVQLHALLATPQATFLTRGWANPQGFPNHKVVP